MLDANNFDEIRNNLSALLYKHSMVRTLTPSKFQVLPSYLRDIVQNYIIDYNNGSNWVLFSKNHEIEALQEFYEQYHQNITNNFLEQYYKERIAFETNLKQILIVWIILDEIDYGRQLDETQFDDLMMNNQNKFIVDARIIKLTKIIVQAQYEQNWEQLQLVQQDEEELNQPFLYDDTEVPENEGQNDDFCDLYD